MSTNVLFNGTTYIVPAVGEDNWGTNVSSYLIAIAAGALQKTGGSFTLTAEVDFGATYGLKSAYFKTRTATPATAGILRLANNEGIQWRNAANSANLTLLVNASNALTYEGSVLLYASLYAAKGDILVASAANTPTALTVGTNDYILTADSAQATGVKWAQNQGITALTGEATGTGPGSTAVTLTNSAVIGKVLTGYTSGAGTVAATDTILQAIQKLNGNDALKVTLAAYTAKGDILAASAANTPAAVAVGTNGYVLTADSGAGSGVSWQLPGSQISSPWDLWNLGLACSVGASALTIALTQADGSTDPGAGAAAVKISFRSSTATSGAYNQRSVTAALSLVVSSGSSLGMTSAVEAKLFVYAIDNAGTVELAISQTRYLDGTVLSTTAEGGAGAADSNSVVYSTTARSNVPVRLIGVLKATEATAGTWATAPSVVATTPLALTYPDSVACQAVKAASDHTATGAYQTVATWTTVKDTKGMLNASTGIVTVPQDGWYSAEAVLGWAATSAAKIAAMRLYIGTVAVQSAQLDLTSSAQMTALCGTKYLSAGATIYVDAYQNTGGNFAYQATAGYSILSVVRVGD